MDNDRIRVEYQPVFDLATGLLVGAEALLRMTDSAGRPLPALDVVQAAEETGQIVEIGRRVLRTAALQAAEWHAQHEVLLPVAVNVSVVQLNTKDFLLDVLGALEAAGAQPEALTVELTESVLLEAGSPGIAQLRDLRSAGIELAIDDFGTGYASLSLLHQLPARTLKIDATFVAGIPDDRRAVAIVAGVIALAKNFDMTCIAEGIETEAQRLYLAERGVQGQGYLLGRPASAAAMSRAIDEAGMLEVPRATERVSVAEARDRAGDQRDHAGDQRDVAGDQRDEAGDQRDEAGDQRDLVADARDQTGDQRDQAADRRDVAADVRDQVGAARDDAAEQRDQDAERLEADPRPEHVTQAGLRVTAARRDAADDRRRASLDRLEGATERSQAGADRDTALTDRDAGATERFQAELDRNIAWADRGSGAGERARSAQDRMTAHADRDASERERGTLVFDDLTGTYVRGPGLAELDRELVRALRAGESLVLAFIDVDGLKRINDAEGHAAGDRVLRQVADALRSNLRPHDIVIRFGGDEFICAISGLPTAETARRLALVNADLASLSGQPSVTVGLAEMGPDDSAQTLIARADAALGKERGQR
jgi:diguanylate cyclase (GGDEF)-like protein